MPSWTNRPNVPKAVPLTGAGLGTRQRTSDLRTKASAADRSRAGLDESKCTGELSDKTPEFVEEVRARVRAWEVAMFAANKRLYAISAQRRVLRDGDGDNLLRFCGRVYAFLFV